LRDIPMRTALAVLPAFLIEATFFLGLGIERVRAMLEKQRPWVAALVLVAAAILPYCAVSLTTHSFEPRAFAILAGIATVASFWFVALPHQAATDLLFLAFVGAVAFSKIPQEQFVSPDEHLPLGILGQLMWIRTTAFALLCLRRVQGVGFGFWPEARHWKI